MAARFRVMLVTLATLKVKTSLLALQSLQELETSDMVSLGTTEVPTFRVLAGYRNTNNQPRPPGPAW